MPEKTINADTLPYVNNMVRGIVPGYARMQRKVIAMGTATAYTARAIEDSFAIIQALTDNSVITLPTAASAPGMTVQVQNVGAAGAAKVSISPAAADAIAGTIATVSSGAAADKDWINTKVTTTPGDHTTLVSDGVNTWWIVAGDGIWASEA